jgi:hypothetical protein
VVRGKGGRADRLPLPDDAGHGPPCVPAGRHRRGGLSPAASFRSLHDGVRASRSPGFAQVLRHHSLQSTAICARVGLGLLCRALSVPLATLYRLYPGSACTNEIQWHDRGFAAVHCVNDTSHLP